MKGILEMASTKRTALVSLGRLLLIASLLLAAAPGAATAALHAAAALEPAVPAPAYLLMENVGQYADEARFLLKQGDRHIWLTGDALWLTVPDPLPAEQDPANLLRQPGRQRNPAAVARPGTAIRFTFPGANPAVTLEPSGRVTTQVSYLTGSDPARWQRGVPVWSGVRYRDLYPGIDLVVGDNATGTVPWRFEARADADLQAVALRAEGADAVTAEAGQLRLDLKGQTVQVALPAWSLEGQPVRATSLAVPQDAKGAFSLTPATESPVEQTGAAGPAALDDAADLIYNTSFTGSAYDAGYGIAVDAAGNAYVTGETQSANLPVTAGAYDPTNSGGTPPTDAFVAKFNPTGTALLYLTYLGGSDLDLGWGIAVSGDLAYVVGETKSANFPGMTGTVTGTDIFAAALNATGSGVRYVTRLGGNGADTAAGVAVEGLDAYLVGTTTSSDLPGSGCGGLASARLVVAKLNSTGAPAYTTCLGDVDFTVVGYGIAVRSGAAYVTGETGPVVGVARDVIVAKYNPDGTLGGGIPIAGSGDEWSSGIAVDGPGNIYLTGTTMSATDFPVTSGTAAWGGGASDAFVLKLSSAFGITFATYLGGSGDDYGAAIAVDTVQAFYVTGTTTSTNFPVSTGAYDTSQNGGLDLFVARMHLGSSAPNKVTYATYLGAGNEDWAYSAATDTGTQAFVTGSSASSAALDSTNALVARLKVGIPPAAPVVSIAASGTSAALSWTAVPSTSKYQIFRSNTPYFQPGDWSSPTPRQEITGLSYPDPAVLTTVGAYFYLVKAINTAPEASASSNQVGKFTFPLVKGVTP